MGRLRDAALVLLGASETPDTTERAGHGTGVVQAYFGDVSARIGTYNPEKVSLDKLRKMQRDPSIRAAIKLQEYGLRAVDYDVSGSEPHVEEFVRACVDLIWSQWVRIAAHGVAEGCAPCEVIYERRDFDLTGDDGATMTLPGWCAPRIKDIDPRSLTSILVDGLGNFAGYQLGEPSGTVLEADKALHYANDVRFGNLWGEARLVASYDPWYARQVLQALQMRFIERRAVPAVHVEFPEGESADGTSNADTAKLIAQGFQSSDTAIWTPAQPEGMPGWTVSLIEDAQRAQTASAFIEAMDVCDKRMMLGVLTPEKVLNGDGGSLALAEAHVSVWTTGIDGTAKDIVEPLNTQLIPRLVRYTFGPDVAVPRVIPGGLAAEQRALLASIAVELIKGGYGSVDFDGLAQRLGIPTSEDESTVDEETNEDGTTGESDLAEIRREGVRLAGIVQRTKVQLAAAGHDV